ncbi:hypothetical protein [Salinarimonas ramus]|uniref:Uncharacterized protein n=1 Tax=Salinarimonas ramus TaxID=690164 RepID=A0A917Q9Q8_9HYPH|nr:hypothetical protein [Salinarimonas ramus]GGK34725.1 hypothetical protein GCM10011322_21840 [Salinarimonas ramus]
MSGTFGHRGANLLSSARLRAGVGLLALVLGAGLVPQVASAQTAPPVLGQPNPAQVTPPARAAAPDGTLAQFFLDAHPVFGLATWTGIAWDGAPVTVRLPAGHPLADGTTGESVRLQPELVASGLSLPIGWRDTRLAAANAYLVGDHLVLEGFTLANEGGTLAADILVLSADALRTLGAAATGEMPAAAEPADVVVQDLVVEVRRGVADAARGSFASRFAADHLVLTGLVARAEADDAEDRAAIPALDIAGFSARDLSGAARFAGSAEFSLGALTLDGSPRSLTGLAQAALGLADPEEDDAPRLFSLSFEDLLLRARRAGSEPAVIVADEGALRVSLGSSASRANASLQGFKASAALLAGTPAEEQARTIAAAVTAEGGAAGLEGGPHLSLDVEADAVLRPGRLRVRLVCLDAPGLADATAALDLEIAEEADIADLGVRDLARARAREMRVAIVDHGLVDIVSDLAGRPLSEMAGEIAASLVQEIAGLPAPVARLTTAPLVGAVQTLEEDGSLAATAPSAGPVPLAAAGLLAAAGTVEPGDLDDCAR